MVYVLENTPETWEEIERRLNDLTNSRDIPKPSGCYVGGNCNAARPIFADKFGRIWRDDDTELVCIYAPKW